MFHWVGLGDNGEPIDEASAHEAGLNGSWETRDAAEAWLTQMWEELLLFDIAEVSLYQGDEMLMNPMKLSE